MNVIGLSKGFMMMVLFVRLGIFAFHFSEFCQFGDVIVNLDHEKRNCISSSQSTVGFRDTILTFRSVSAITSIYDKL